MTDAAKALIAAPDAETAQTQADEIYKEMVTAQETLKKHHEELETERLAVRAIEERYMTYVAMVKELAE